MQLNQFRMIFNGTPVTLSVATTSVIGRPDYKKGKPNEDAFCVFPDSPSDPDEVSPFVWIAMADGMGDYEGSRKASRLAVKLSKAAKAKLARAPPQSLVDAKNCLEKFATPRAIGARIRKWVAAKQMWYDMGTTSATGLFVPEGLITCHAGDTGIWHWHPDTGLQRVTEVLHNVAEDPQVSPEARQHYIEKRVNPASVLSRWIDGGRVYLADFNFAEIKPRSRLLWLTDGMYEKCPGDIAWWLSSSDNPQDIVGRAMAGSKRAGSYDDRTAAAVVVS